MKDIKHTHDGYNLELPRQESLSQLVPEFYQFVIKLINDKLLVPDSMTTMKLLLNEDTEEIFRSFSRYYLRIKRIGGFLNFKWRSLSGGEQSYLSLMSRFYHTRHHSYNDLPKSLVVLIDEGDVGYHPEWQRKFLNTTIHFLKRLFTGKTIQLILTANSPFISSDLPKSNVLFIEKKDKLPSDFHGKDNNRQNTFAANIHTLFSDSFYMDGVLMGEFAKKRINDIIKFLNDGRNKLPNAEYKKTINMIGEPILRKKLQDMWGEKYGPIEERERLLKRIAEIDKQIKTRDDDQEPA